MLNIFSRRYYSLVVNFHLAFSSDEKHKWDRIISRWRSTIRSMRLSWGKFRDRDRLGEEEGERGRRKDEIRSRRGEIRSCDVQRYILTSVSKRGCRCGEIKPRPRRVAWLSPLPYPADSPTNQIFSLFLFLSLPSPFQPLLAVCSSRDGAHRIVSRA